MGPTGDHGNPVRISPELNRSLWKARCGHRR